MMNSSILNDAKKATWLIIARSMHGSSALDVWHMSLAFGSGDMNLKSSIRNLVKDQKIDLLQGER